MEKKTDKIVIKELFNSLDKLSFIERETRMKVEKLQDKIKTEILI